jgi:cobalt-zinc-cadmium resistance protein CzcA
MVKPAAFGQLIILLVFTPLLMLEGVEGKTFIPMGATVMLALVGAFIFSFTFVPAMTALLVRDPKSAHLDANDRVVFANQTAITLLQLPPAAPARQRLVR